MIQKQIKKFRKMFNNCKLSLFKIGSTCISDCDRCPVQSFVKYKRMLNQKCTFLFQRGRDVLNKQGRIFDNAPIGHNKLGQIKSKKEGKLFALSN